MPKSYLIAVLHSALILLFSCAWPTKAETQKYSITSEVYEDKRSFYVKLPRTYSADAENKYPVIYLLDDKRYMQHYFTISDLLSEGGMTPEFILIGIEHDNRLLDLTPTVIQGREGTGGANSLLQHIELELIPDIDKRFKTNGFKILAGHSLGGLFTLHAMQAKPDLFDAHFAFSPSLYWDEQTTVNSVKTFLESKHVHHNFLYMNMGNEGLDDPYDNSIAMRDGYMELVRYIENNAPNKFRFFSHHLEQESHMSTAVIGPFYALRSLYRKFPLPTAKIKQGLDSILKHYEELSAEVGVEINATQGMMFNAGMYHLWADEDLKKGIDILEYNISQHPDSGRSLDGLAQLYQANGQLNKALKHCNQSLKHGESESSSYQHYKQRCDTIRSKLNEPD